MSTYPGRGAWSAVGKDNGARTYVYLPGKPMDGHRQPNGTFASINHEAVNLGVKAMQERINTLNLTADVVADGVLGPGTTKALKVVQEHYHLVPDGNAGAKTMRALWHPLIAVLETSHGLPAHILWGIAKHESLLDPGAVGETTPADRGLVQFNTDLGSVSIAQAHDAAVALPKAASRLETALDNYAGKGADLQLKCTVASWNAPAWASQWYHNGQAPNDRITKYVADVLDAAETF